MARAWNSVPKTAIFLAGVTVGAFTSRRQRPSKDTGEIAHLKHAVQQLETRLAAAESAASERFSELETRLQEHAAKLADIPSTSQIVAAMEHLLSKTMSSLDERLTAQARSIEVLKTTVSQTDSLLEKVLESLDALQSDSESSDLSTGSFLPKPIA
jgi:chromosome segregation ATPase